MWWPRKPQPPITRTDVETWRGGEEPIVRVASVCGTGLANGVFVKFKDAEIGSEVTCGKADRAKPLSQGMALNRSCSFCLICTENEEQVFLF